MKEEDDTRESATEPNSARHPSSRKAYRSPVLRTFGSLRHMTQGSTGRKADWGHTRRRYSGGGSDRGIKENIVKIGEHTLGIGLYLFDFKPEYRDLWGHGRQFGVMADEVEAVFPEAVATHADGYKLVDYAMLGMRRNG